MRPRAILAATAAAATLVGGGVAAAAAVGSGGVASATVVHHSPHNPGLTLAQPGAATPRPANTTANVCGYTAVKPADRFTGIPTFDAARAARPYDWQLITNSGPITVRMRTDAAPCTTNSFRFLTDRHYFDRTHCHRLTTQRLYVLQCGDPTGTGSGGPGYQFNDENLAGATYPAGTVAMANAGPDTNGSQFFFTTADTKLSPAYTPFGTVVGGMAALRRIAAAGEDDQNGPGDGYPNHYTEILTALARPSTHR